MKSKRRSDVAGVEANTRREKVRKTIDKLVLKYWGEKVETYLDDNGKRTYIIDKSVIVQFNTADDVRKKRKLIDRLLERICDGQEI